VAKVHNKATPTRFPTTTSLTRISTTDLPTILDMVFPNLSLSTRRCSSPVPPGLLPVPLPPNKPRQPSSTPTHTARTYTASNILQVRMMTLGITTNTRMSVAPFQETTTSSCTETRVFKASWAVWVRLLVGLIPLEVREVDPRELLNVLADPLRTRSSHTVVRVRTWVELALDRTSVLDKGVPKVALVGSSNLTLEAPFMVLAAEGSELGPVMVLRHNSLNNTKARVRTPNSATPKQDLRAVLSTLTNVAANNTGSE
jgi:hypothetical protein